MRNFSSIQTSRQSVAFCLIQLPLLLLIFTASAGAAAANPAAATPASELQALVESAVRPLMQRENIPGMAVAITENGKSSYFNFGVLSDQGKQPVTEQTLFEIGSISKTFTVTLAALAEVDERLSLNDPVSRYLPELKGTEFGDVQLFHLATHTAGSFPLQVPEDIQNTDQLMDYLKNFKSTYAVGEKRTYANPGIGLLGLITAKTLRQPYAEALEKKLFPGLGLENTYINVPAEKMPQYAQGYNKKHQPVRVGIDLLGEEAYGVKSTSADLTRFVEANMQLIKLDKSYQRAINASHYGYFKTDFYVQDLIWEQYPYPLAEQRLLDGNSSQMIRKDHPVQAIKPPLAPQQNVLINKTGSTGGFSAYVAFIPQKKLGFVMLANKSISNEARVSVMYQILSHLNQD